MKTFDPHCDLFDSFDTPLTPKSKQSKKSDESKFRQKVQERSMKIKLPLYRKEHGETFWHTMLTLLQNVCILEVPFYERVNVV